MVLISSSSNQRGSGKKAGKELVIKGGQGRRHLPPIRERGPGTLFFLRTTDTPPVGCGLTSCGLTRAALEKSVLNDIKYTVFELELEGVDVGLLCPIRRGVRVQSPVAVPASCTTTTTTTTTTTITAIPPSLTPGGRSSRRRIRRCRWRHRCCCRRCCGHRRRGGGRRRRRGCRHR